MNRKYFIVLLLLICFVFLFVDPAYAGPGGAIAKAITKSFWGKLILIILAIIISPIIIYVFLREHIGVFRARNILSKVSKVDKRFNWLNLEKEIRNAYGRVHNAWSKGDMSIVQEYVSSWYWQNQQLLFLDEWKRRNLQNVCHLKIIGRIRPLFIHLSDEQDFEGTRIAFSIFGEIEDYLQDLESHEIIEGSTGYQEIEKVWIFEMTNGKWLLDEIRDGSFSLMYAKMNNILPENFPEILSTQTVKAK
jgi:hypothetical protein